MTNSQSTIAVGSSIRKRRKELGLTLKDLAGKTGLSTAYISQVERSQAMPSLMSLYQLAEVLNVSMDELISTSKSFKTYRKGNELEKIPLQSEIEYFRLSNPFPNQRIDPILLEIPADYESSKIEGEGHDGEGFLYVLEGKLSINYQGNDFDLEANDSMHYDLQHTLSIINKLKKTPAKLLWVGTVILE